MNILNKVFVGALLVFLVGAVGTAYLFFRGGTPFHPVAVNQSQEFAAESLRNLVIDTNSMDISLVKSRTDQLAVRLSGNASQHVADSFQFETKAEGDTLHIKLPQNSLIDIGVNYSDVRLEVQIPEQTLEQITIDSGFGDIHVEQLQAGQLNINSNGDIYVHNFSGQEVVIHSHVGDIALDRVQAKMDITSSVGDIKLDLQQVTDDIAINSTGVGDVKVRLSERPTALQVDLQTTVGEISSKLPDARLEMNGRQKLVASIGTDGPLLKIRTTTGDIKIE